MLTKEIVNSQVSDMPSHFTLDELIERLIVVEKINEGIKEVELGRTLSEQELDIKMAEWFA